MDSPGRANRFHSQRYPVLACAPGVLQGPLSPKYSRRFCLYRCIPVIVVPGCRAEIKNRMN
jgi:hypothetical protein